jgi:hypothetical protein
MYLAVSSNFHFSPIGDDDPILKLSCFWQGLKLSRWSGELSAAFCRQIAVWVSKPNQNPLKQCTSFVQNPIQMCNSFFLRYTTPWIYIYIKWYNTFWYNIYIIYIHIYIYIYVYGLLVPGSVHSPFINTWGFFVRDWAWRHVDRWMLLGRMAGAARVRRSWVFSVVIKGGWKMP